MTNNKSNYIRGPIHKGPGTFSFLGIFYFTHKIYGVQVDIGVSRDLHIPSPVYPTGVVHVLLHVEVTDIDLDAMKYKSSLIFGSAYIVVSFHSLAHLWKLVVLMN